MSITANRVMNIIRSRLFISRASCRRDRRGGAGIRTRGTSRSIYEAPGPGIFRIATNTVHPTARTASLACSFMSSRRHPARHDSHRPSMPVAFPQDTHFPGPPAPLQQSGREQICGLLSNDSFALRMDARAFLAVL